MPPARALPGTKEGGAFLPPPYRNHCAGPLTVEALDSSPGLRFHRAAPNQRAAVHDPTARHRGIEDVATARDRSLGERGTVALVERKEGELRIRRRKLVQYSNDLVVPDRSDGDHRDLAQIAVISEAIVPGDVLAAFCSTGGVRRGPDVAADGDRRGGEPLVRGRNGPRRNPADGQFDPGQAADPTRRIVMDVDKNILAEVARGPETEVLSRIAGIVDTDRAAGTVHLGHDHGRQHQQKSSR